jgi:hypothetical protein
LQFTAQSWLVWLYLHCQRVAPPDVSCPTPAQVADVNASIVQGYLTWQAFPFDGQLELLSSFTLNASIAMTHALDDAYKLPRKTVLSQRDVPGMTRGVLGTLASSGVTAISVGVNGGSTPPDVPRAFQWHDPSSNATLLGLYLSGGYGGIQQLHPYRVPTILPNSTHAMVVAWRGDNSGPPQVDEVLSDWIALQKQFPKARVRASSFDAFVAAVQSETDVVNNLPVVHHELGDTWIHGVGSTPAKINALSVMQDEMEECFRQGDCSWNDFLLQAGFHAMLKASEHTFGLDVKSTLTDMHANYSNVEFATVRPRADYQTLEASWQRQLNYSLPFALAQFGDHPLADRMRRKLAGLVPEEPQWRSLSPVSETSIILNGVELEWDVTGAITAVTLPSGMRGLALD